MTATTAAAGDSGDPTAALLALAEKELQVLLAKKRQTEKTLAAIESNIYALEGNYLEESSQFGNIIRGFEGYLSSRPERKRARINETDRIFSSSSVTFRMSDAGGLSPLKSSRHMEDGESSAESEEYYPSHSVSRPGLTDKTPHSTNGASARKRRSGNASSWKKRQKNRRSTAARSEDEEDDSDDEEDSIPDEDD